MLDAVFAQELGTAVFFESLSRLFGYQMARLLAEEGARVDHLLRLLLALVRVDGFLGLETTLVRIDRLLRV